MPAAGAGDADFDRDAGGTGWCLLGLPLDVAVLLGAILAPTDPVLAHLEHPRPGISVAIASAEYSASSSMECLCRRSAPACGPFGRRLVPRDRGRLQAGSHGGSGHGKLLLHQRLLAHTVDFVAQARGFLEFQVLRVLVHARFQLLDQRAGGVRIERGVIGGFLRDLA